MAISFSRGSSQPGDQTHVSCLQVDSLPLRHLGSPQHRYRYICVNVLWWVTQLCSTLCDPMDYSLPGFSRQVYWRGLPCPSPGDLPNPGMEPRSSVLQADSLPSKPPGKPKNTGVGSLTLLQGIFLTQEFNWGLLHCRQIVYQLSYQRSPYM